MDIRTLQFQEPVEVSKLFQRIPSQLIDDVFVVVTKAISYKLNRSINVNSNYSLVMLSDFSSEEFVGILLKLIRLRCGRFFLEKL